LRTGHCHELEFTFVIAARQELQFSFLSTSSATHAGALDLLISARMICFIMVQSLRSTAPQDAENLLLPGTAFRMPNSFSSVWINIITTSLGECRFPVLGSLLSLGGGL
jgi:hypothetical protein